MAMGDLKAEPSMEDILASIKRIIADDSQPAEEAVMHVEQTASGGESTRFSGANLHLVEDREPAKRENAEEVLELTQPIEPAESPAPTLRQGPRDALPPRAARRHSVPRRRNCPRRAATAPKSAARENAAAQ